MTVRIRELTFRAILGILEKERKTPQRIVVEAEFTYGFSDGNYLDYALVADTIRHTMQEKKFFLVEEALEELFALLKKKFPAIETAKLTICKPDILPNCRVCVEDFRSFL